MPPIPRRQDTQPANPFTDLICSINGLAQSNQAVVTIAREEIDELRKQNEKLTEQVNLLNEIVITGDPKNDKASILEILRRHTMVIGVLQWAAAIVGGAVLTASVAGIWYVLLHVFGGVP